MAYHRRKKAFMAFAHCIEQTADLSLSDDKIRALSELTAFADDKSDVNQSIKLVFHRVQNIVGKGENAGHQHFLLFPQCFKLDFLAGEKSLDYVVKG